MTTQVEAQQSERVAEQQPDCAGHAGLPAVTEWLHAQDALVAPSEAVALRRQVGDVAQGGKVLLLAGDCVEPFSEFDDTSLTAKVNFIGDLARTLAPDDQGSVVKVGRMAGQFGKPRSNAFEMIDGRELPAFRGEIVNGYEPTPETRTPDPWRMRQAYELSRRAMRHLEQARMDGREVWASHEALVLDYETAFVRADVRTGDRYLGSTHLPWVGERTRAVNGPHVALLRGVSNPVGVKIGPNMSPDELDELCETLNPFHEGGRLVLIFRLGVSAVRHAAEPLLEVVRRGGHNAAIVIDPMHGNIRRGQNGQKTRAIQDIEVELRSFAAAAAASNTQIHGLHIETTPFDVTECIGLGVTDDDLLKKTYTTMCDPRLNAEQAHHIVSVFRETR